MRIQKTLYQCDECKTSEDERETVLNWLTVGIIRNELVPPHRVTNPVQQVTYPSQLDFCSPECLAAWAQKRKGD